MSYPDRLQLNNLQSNNSSNLKEILLPKPNFQSPNKVTTFVSSLFNKNENSQIPLKNSSLRKRKQPPELNNNSIQKSPTQDNFIKQSIPQKLQPMLPMPTITGNTQLPSPIMPVPFFSSNLTTNRSSRIVSPPPPRKQDPNIYNKPLKLTTVTTDEQGHKVEHKFTYTREHFLTFDLPGKTQFKSGDGHYKNAYTYSHVSSLISAVSNDKILLLQFKDQPEEVISAKRFFDRMSSSLKQYDETKEAFGQDNCVTIYNAKTALEAGHFVVEYIPKSLKEVIDDLSKPLIGPLQQPEDLEKFEARDVKSILEQIRYFFTQSLEAKIDTDLNLGNFRIVQTSGGYKVKLTDFREEVDPEDSDLFPNKTTELKYLKRDLSPLISPDLFEDFFKDQRNFINENNK